jgi:hypothetical protein
MGDLALFVSEKYGIVSMSQPGVISEPTNLDDSILDEPSYTIQALQRAEARRDQLYGAFRKFLARDKGFNVLVAPFSSLRMDDVDETVIAVSHLLLDSLPSSDPRWAEEKGSASFFFSLRRWPTLLFSTTGNTVVTSLLLKNQLEEKKQKHQQLLHFFQSYLKISDVANAELAIHAEKLEAAIQLRELQNALEQNSQKYRSSLQVFFFFLFIVVVSFSQSRVIQQSMKAVLTARKQSAIGTSYQDVFYTTVRGLFFFFFFFSFVMCFADVRGLDGRSRELKRSFLKFRKCLNESCWASLASKTLPMKSWQPTKPFRFISFFFFFSFLLCKSCADCEFTVDDLLLLTKINQRKPSTFILVCSKCIRRPNSKYVELCP